MLSEKIVWGLITAKSFTPFLCAAPKSQTLHLSLSSGRKRTLTEKNVWGLITAESFTPFLELDFIGPDIFEVVLHKSKEEVRQVV